MVLIKEREPGLEERHVEGAPSKVSLGGEAESQPASALERELKVTFPQKVKV